MNRRKEWAEAWKAACRVIEQTRTGNIQPEDAINVLEELMIIHGNPNAPAPQGVIIEGKYPRTA